MRPCLFLATLLLLTCCGCRNTIVPPRAIDDPVTVHLLDHGRHPSLVIPRADGSYVRYVYGDWNWYALGNVGFLQAVDSMLLPGRAALGRKTLPSPDDLTLLYRTDPTEHSWSFPVPRTRAQALDEQLDALFRAQADREVYNREYDLAFVPHHAPYSFFHSCNHVMKDWLQALGCHVRGQAYFSHWKLAAP